MRISVIMPSFNQVQFIDTAVRSVLDQRGDFELELVVVDGGSTDGTVERLATLADGRLRWSSRPDRGQTHALNRGLAEASGEIIGWLNSDDCYEPGALAAVAATFQRRPEAQWLYGLCQIVDANGRPIRRLITLYKQLLGWRFSRSGLLCENYISQPAVFLRRSLYQRVGLLNESLRYVMDYEYWLRLAEVAPATAVHRYLADFRVHAASKSATGYASQFQEQETVARRFAAGRPWLMRLHRFNIFKTVLAYRLLDSLHSAKCQVKSEK